uniref:Uncharacterized protein n=1 Tax=Zea mays TaxID=4577 RepID=A0A804NP05_MAIZE
SELQLRTQKSATLLFFLSFSFPLLGLGGYSSCPTRKTAPARGRGHVLPAAPPGRPRRHGGGGVRARARGGRRRRCLRGGEIVQQPRVPDVRRPAPPRRVAALVLRRRGVVPVGGVPGGPAVRRRVGRLGPEPQGPEHGRHAGAGGRPQRRRRRRRRVRGADLQHLRHLARLPGGPPRLPDVRPRRRARRRRPRPDLRHAQAPERHGRRRGQPGVAGGALLRRDPDTRNERRQHERQGHAEPPHRRHRRRQRWGQYPQEEKYARDPERRELGPPAAHGRHLRSVPQDVQVRRPGLVLPPRGVPAGRVRRRGVRLGHRHPPREPVQGDHLLAPPEHRDHGLRPRHSAGLCAVLEAEEGAQVPGVLERVPPLGGVHGDRAGRRQRLQGHGHPGRGAEVEDGLRRRRLRAGRRRRGAGGRHVGRRAAAPEAGGKDLQRRPLAAVYVIYIYIPHRRRRRGRLTIYLSDLI